MDGLGDYFLIIFVVSCKFPRSLELLNMSAREGIASTSTSSRGQKGGQKGVEVGRPGPKLSIDLLLEQEFWAHFYILNSVSIILEDDEPLTFKKLSHNATTYFSKE